MNNKVVYIVVCLLVCGALAATACGFIPLSATGGGSCPACAFASTVNAEEIFCAPDSPNQDCINTTNCRIFQVNNIIEDTSNCNGTNGSCGDVISSTISSMKGCWKTGGTCGG